MSELLANQNVVYVIFIVLALGVFLVFTGIAQLASRSESVNEARSRRMRMIARGAKTEELLAVLKPSAPNGFLTRLPLIGKFPRMLQQSGLSISLGAYLLLCVAIAVVATSVALRFMLLPESLAIGVTVGLLVPFAIVHSARQKRQEALILQLPDALDLMSRGLRVGHPLSTSIDSVAKEMDDPIATEFGIIFDQVSYGDDLPDAVQEFAERIDLEDVHYLSVSVGIQHGTGGDLARVLHVLSRVVRNRIAMRRKIKAISAEGRMTAWFLSSLPFIIYFMTSMMTPSYYAGVSGDPLFRPMMFAVIGLTVLNFLILRRLVNFRL